MWMDWFIFDSWHSVLSQGSSSLQSPAAPVCLWTGIPLTISTLKPFLSVHVWFHCFAQTWIGFLLCFPSADSSVSQKINIRPLLACIMFPFALLGGFGGGVAGVCCWLACCLGCWGGFFRFLLNIIFRHSLERQYARWYNQYVGLSCHWNAYRLHTRSFWPILFSATSMNMGSKAALKIWVCLTFIK